MILPYKKIKLKLKGEDKFIFKKFPGFILRSALGRSLYKTYCIQRNKVCKECIIKETCTYSFLFESNVSYRFEVPAFSHTPPHPMFISDFSVEEDTIFLELTFIGEKAISYIPYTIASFQRMKYYGLGKTRIKFNEQVIEEIEDKWIYENTPLFKRKRKNITIFLKTPLSIFTEGKILYDFEPFIFFKSILRRVYLLTLYYGDFKEKDKLLFNDYYKQLKEDWDRYNIEIKKKNIKKRRYKYYSSRQEKEIIYKGIIGEIKLKGEFDNRLFSLLKAGELFNTGKLISFSFGKIVVS